MDEGHAVHVDPKIAPVCRQYVAALLRQSYRLPYLADRVSARPQQVRILLFQHLRVRVTVRAAYIRSTGHDLVQQFEVFFHLFARARYVVLHLVDEGLVAERHADVHRASVRILADDAEAVRDLAPVHLDAVIIHHLTDLSRIVRAAYVAKLVQRRFEFESAPSETRRAAARQVVLFYEQDLLALARAVQSCRKTRIAGADNDDVITFIQAIHLLYS